MDCAECGAPIGRRKEYCVICGEAARQSGGPSRARQVEAVAYEDLATVMESDETLLGVTRGRVMGGWRIRVLMNPRVMLSPFANVGLTSDRLIIQPVLPSTGRAIPNCFAAVPLSDVYSVMVADADAIDPGATVRIVVQLADGESLRMRVTGRIGSAASGLAEVWRSLYSGTPSRHKSKDRCANCRRELDRSYRYCPFCGATQGSA